MKKNVWDNNVPVETSSYIEDNDVVFYNEDKFAVPKDKPTMIDLFSGAGGFSVGCEWAGFYPVLGIDHFKPAIDTWKTNHPCSIACLGDIKKIQPKLIKNYLENKGINSVNLITGGVPCQGFSIANRKHNDNDKRNFLFLEYMKFVDVFQPEYIILENVSGMRSTAGGKFEQNIKNYMKQLGYSPHVSMLNAADFGVPQIRKRLIFVGLRQDIAKKESFNFPKPIYQSSKYLTVKDALSDLPPLKNNEQKNSYAVSPKNKYQLLMRQKLSINNGFEKDTLLNHRAPNHPKSTIELIKNTNQGQPMYTKFKQRIRLDNEKPSPTQLAGGIRPSFQFGHPLEARGLSTRERARLQSFPDNYIFKGGIVQERVQTGNAVPPLLIYNISSILYNNIKNRKKENV